MSEHAVSRMPTAFSILLACHCKKTDSVDLKAPLHSYIKNTYSDREAQEADDDLVTIQQLRTEISLASTNATQPGMRDNLAKCATGVLEAMGAAWNMLPHAVFLLCLARQGL